MSFLRVSVLAISIALLLGCDNNDDHNNNAAIAQESRYENFVLPTLKVNPTIRGQLLNSEYSINSDVNATNTAGLSAMTRSLTNHSFRMDSIADYQSLDSILIQAKVCLDVALTSCMKLTHQLSGAYLGDIVPVDLRTTLIDLLIKNHGLGAETAQTRINDYLQLTYDVSKMTIIPKQYVDQQKVLEDFATAAKESNQSLDEYVVELAKRIVEEPELRHTHHYAAGFQPKLTGDQLIEDAIQHATDLSLLKLLASPSEQNTNTTQAKITERLRYFDATLDSMLDSQLRLSELQGKVAPIIKKIEQDYQMPLMSTDAQQFHEFAALVHGVIFDLNYIQYVQSEIERQKIINQIELVLEHLMFKRDEITLNLDSTYQNHVALNLVLAKNMGVSEENLKLITQYIGQYVHYYDHLNALSYYLLAEDIKYHQSTLSVCDMQNTTSSNIELDAAQQYCSLYTEYLHARKDYLSQDVPPLQLQGSAGVISLPQITGITDIGALDLETALLAIQSNRAQLLDTQLRDQIQDMQQKNDQTAKLNQLLNLMNNIQANFPNHISSDFQQKRLELSNKYQQPIDDAEQLVCITAKCYTEKPIIEFSTKAEWGSKINLIKGTIDILGNTQQMNMLRLQSMINKRNEAFEMINLAIKMQYQRANIIGNMR